MSSPMDFFLDKARRHSARRSDLSSINHTAIMETDREAVNLAPDVPEATDAIIDAPAKQPRKRFIGRRAANARAVENGDTIEGSGALSGMPSNPPA